MGREQTEAVGNEIIAVACPSWLETPLITHDKALFRSKDLLACAS